jgi:hypothetical protein
MLGILLFCLKLANAYIVGLDYFKNEQENVVNNCKKNLECNERLTTNLDVVEATQDNLKTLENYYNDYWKKNSCQSENEPCGPMWGQCCSNMVCQYLNTQSGSKSNILNEKIGLCSSDPYIKYSI